MGCKQEVLQAMSIAFGSTHTPLRIGKSHPNPRVFALLLPEKKLTYTFSAALLLVKASKRTVRSCSKAWPSQKKESWIYLSHKSLPAVASHLN